MTCDVLRRVATCLEHPSARPDGTVSILTKGDSNKVSIGSLESSTRGNLYPKRVLEALDPRAEVPAVRQSSATAGKYAHDRDVLAHHDVHSLSLPTLALFLSLA